VEEYDVAVIGAGPAGASAAMAACRAGASVVLVDRSDFPRDKACGDGIAPHALDVLRGLGVTTAVDGFAPVPALSLRSPGGAVVTRRLARPAFTVPRRVFDAGLVAAALSAGAVWRRRTVRSIRDDGHRIAVDGVFAARVVVGADGAGSTVRRYLGYPRNPDGHLALAIRGYAPAPDGRAEQRIVTATERWPAYAWAFPIGDGRANVGYGEVLRGPAVTREHLIRRLAALLPDIDPGGVTDLKAHLLPLSTRRPPPGRGRLLLAGDALSLINPFTGEGIFYAVRSGSLAGAAAAHAVRSNADDAAARRYAAELTRRLGRHLRHSGVAAALGRRRFVVDATVRAARDHQRVFDTMVELGLGDGTLTAGSLARIAAGIVRR
jgi:geranylgeranyl reductase family protein